jgi:hypothetical protein
MAKEEARRTQQGLHAAGPWLGLLAFFGRPRQVVRLDSPRLGRGARQQPAVAEEQQELPGPLLLGSGCLLPCVVRMV